MQSWRSRSDEAVDDFDDFDPTPYSGGYDQTLTYGRPLPPSDELCHSLSAAGDVDYERPQYSSGSQIDSASDYGGRSQRQEHGSDYGLGFGGERPKRDYGGRAEQESGYGYQEEGNRYGGSGYRRNEEERYGNQSYGGSEYRKSEEEGYGGGDVGYDLNEESGYGGKASYGRLSYGDEEEGSGYGKASHYGGEEYGRSNYGIGSYDEGEQKHHGHQKKHHHRHNYDED